MARKAMVTLDGFDELLKKIEAAGGKIDGAVDRCAAESAGIMQGELRSSMQRKDVATDLVNRMPKANVERDGNAVYVQVGFKKGKYDPKNLSDGYKAVFINYGTPRVKPRDFVSEAKRKARSKIKKQEEQTLNEILKELTR